MRTLLLSVGVEQHFTLGLVGGQGLGVVAMRMPSSADGHASAPSRGVAVSTAPFSRAIRPTFD